MVNTVLVVDDNPADQRTMSRGLANAALVGSAEEALTWIEENGAPSIAVVDVTLPRMSGFELAHALKGVCEVVVVGARPGMEIEDEARALELDVRLVHKRDVAATLAPARAPSAFWSKLVAAFA